MRPNLPAGLRQIVTLCLKKRPADRYPDARSLIEDLRVLRRETESGLARTVSMKDRFGAAFQLLRHLTPAEYALLAGGILAVVITIYLLTTNGGLVFPLIPFAAVSLVLYRNIRNQQRKMLELFARKVAKLPEVRFIIFEGGKITVCVDRAVGQLYGRISAQTESLQPQIVFAEPMSVVIRDDLSAEETRCLLAGAGVQYVRDDAIQDR